MKTVISVLLLSAVPYLAIGTLQVEQTDITVLFRFLSELPILIATIWLFLKLANLHLETMDKIISSFGEREQNQREHHKGVVDSLLKTIQEQSK